jgi:hypothetical protein
MRGCRLDLSRSGDGQTAEFREHENECFVFKIGASYFYNLSHLNPLKKDWLPGRRNIGHKKYLLILLYFIYLI